MTEAERQGARAEPEPLEQPPSHEAGGPLAPRLAVHDKPVPVHYLDGSDSSPRPRVERKDTGVSSFKSSNG